MTQLPLNKSFVSLKWKLAEGDLNRFRRRFSIVIGRYEHCTTTAHGEFCQEQNKHPPSRPTDRGSHGSMCEIKDREQSPFRSTRPHERPDEGRDRGQPSGYACLDNSQSKNPLKFAMNKRWFSQANPPSDWNAIAFHESSFSQVERKSKMKLFIISPFLQIKVTLKLILA